MMLLWDLSPALFVDRKDELTNADIHERDQ